MKKVASSTKSSIELCNESLVAIQSLYLSRSSLHKLIAESRDIPPYESALMLEAEDDEGILSKATESIEKLKEAGEALKKELKEFSDKLPDFFENTKATLDVVSKEIDTMLPGDSFLSKISSGISSMTRALFGTQNSPIAKISKMAYDLNAIKAIIAACTKSIVDSIKNNQAQALKDPEIQKAFDAQKEELMDTPLSEFTQEAVEKFGLPDPEGLAKLIEPALKPPDGMFAGFKKLSKSLGFDVGGKMPFDKYLTKEEFIEDFMNSTPRELSSIFESAPKGPVKPSPGTQQVGAALQQVQQVQDDAEEAGPGEGEGDDGGKSAVMDIVKNLKIKGLDLEKHAELLTNIILGEDDKKDVAKESFASRLGNLLFESEDFSRLFEAPEGPAGDKDVKIKDYSALRLMSQLAFLAFSDDPKMNPKKFKGFSKKKAKFRARDAYDMIVKAVAKKLGAKPKEKGLKAVPSAFGKSCNAGDYAIWGYEGVEPEEAEKLAKTKLPDETYASVLGGLVARKGKEIKFFMNSKYKTYNKAGLAAEAWLEGEEVDEPEEANAEKGKKGEKADGSEETDSEEGKKGEKAGTEPSADAKEKKESFAKKKPLINETAVFERWSMLAGIS